MLSLFHNSSKREPKVQLEIFQKYLRYRCALLKILLAVAQVQDRFVLSSVHIPSCLSFSLMVLNLYPIGEPFLSVVSNINYANQNAECMIIF